jgi:hypothetical protein
MGEFKFYRDKKEKVSCSIEVEGTNLDNSKIRLLLESKNGLNYYFNGKIDSNGRCIIDVPALKKLEENETGSAVIEAIVDEAYFKLLEQPFTIKNSVTIKFNQEEEKLEESEKPKIKFSLEEKKKKEIMEDDEKPLENVEKEKEDIEIKSKKNQDNKDDNENEIKESKKSKVKTDIISFEEFQKLRKNKK